MADVDYGVHVSNKYSFLPDDDHDPNEILAQQLSSVTQKDAKKKEDIKKKDKKLTTQPANKSLPTSDKKTTAVPFQKQQTPPSGRTPTGEQKNATQTKDREGKENKFSKPSGGAQETYRGGATGARRPPRSDRPPRQGERPPRFGGSGGGFGAGESQESVEGFQQNEEGGRRGRGRGGVTFVRGGGSGRGRGFGGRGGGFNDQPNRGFNDQSPQEPGDNATLPVEPNDNVQRDEFSYNYGGEERGFRGRGRGRGGGGFRGGRGGFFGGGGRGRQFDRTSGSDKTGVKAVDKRDGSGPFNWGTAGDQLEGENEGLNATPQSGDETQPQEGDQEGKTGDDQIGDAVPGKEEETPKELTLDEWRAKQAPTNKPAFNIRQPGEGEEKAEWKKMKLKELKRQKEQDKDMDEGYEEEEEDSGQKKKQPEVPIRFVFSDGGGFARTGRGARGGGRGYRGGGRGGAGFGGAEGEDTPRYRGSGFGGGSQHEGGDRGSYGRGGGQRDIPYKMDEESFPQLGAA